MQTPTIVTDSLDRIESVLPAVPARVFRLQRTVAGTMCDRTATVVQAISDSSRNLFETARISGQTVTGQARAATEDVAKTARVGVNTVVGQARAATAGVAKSARSNARTVAGQAGAQGRRVGTKANREATGLIDSAIDSLEGAVETAERTVADVSDVSDAGSGPYESRTKAELLERAKELGIEGRSTMSKPQLIRALRNA